MQYFYFFAQLAQYFHLVDVDLHLKALQEGLRIGCVCQSCSTCRIYIVSPFCCVNSYFNFHKN